MVKGSKNIRNNPIKGGDNLSLTGNSQSNYMNEDGKNMNSYTNQMAFSENKNGGYG
jgi:hypothetical protein